MKKVIRAMCLLVITSLVTSASAQDTLRLTIPDAEAIFLKKNLLLLAAKYNIDEQRALIIQAKAYPNPNFGWTEAVSRPPASAPNAETSVGIQQLILLAGKRNDNIAMAKTNTLLAEDAFADLLRTLKFSLRSDFISIYYWQQSAKVYDEEINGLKKVVVADSMQLKDGFIPKTQFVLDQSQLYSLQSEYNDLKNQIDDKESEVRFFLDSLESLTYIIPILDTGNLHHIDPRKYALAALLDSAHNNRTDLRIARHTLVLSQQNLKLQKANAVPDITLGYDYDTHGSAWPDIHLLSLSFNLPIFDQNRGNIKSAKYAIKASEATLTGTDKQVQENVYRALQLAITNRDLYVGLDKNFPAQFDSLARESLDQYIKRNMSMLTFLAFYDSYKTNTVQLNYILSNMVNAYANIDYMTGTDFFIK